MRDSETTLQRYKANADESSTLSTETSRQKTALIYARVSTEKQRLTGSSLDSQVALCAEHALSLGYSIGRSTREVHSGGELWERTLLAKDRLSIQRGEFQALIVYSADRLSRDPAHLFLLAEECRKHNVKLIFVNDLTHISQEEILSSSTNSFSVRDENRVVKERMQRGRHTQVLSGKIHSWGTDLFGYRRDKERGVRVIFEPEANIVRDMYRWIAVDGLSRRAVERRLNERGIPPPSIGKRNFKDGRTPYWGHGTVRRILTEPAYKGETWAWRWTRSKPIGQGVTSRPVEESIKLSDSTTPAIVSPEEWQKVQEHLAAQRIHNTPQKERLDLLRGFIFCAVCGKRMRGETEDRVRRVYRCSSRMTPSGHCGGKRVRADACEKFVWERIKTSNASELISRRLEELNSSPEDSQLRKDLETLHQEIERLERRREVLVASQFNEQVPEELREFTHLGITRIERDIAQLKATATDIESRIAKRSEAISEIARLLDSCEHRNLEDLVLDEKRLVLKILDIRVEASGRQWNVIYD